MTSSAVAIWRLRGRLERALADPLPRGQVLVGELVPDAAPAATSQRAVASSGSRAKSARISGAGRYAVSTSAPAWLR